MNIISVLLFLFFSLKVYTLEISLCQKSLIPFNQVIKEDKKCFPHIEENAKRILRIGLLDSYNASAVIINNKNKHQLGLFLMANHSLPSYIPPEKDKTSTYFHSMTRGDHYLYTFPFHQLALSQQLKTSFVLFRPSLNKNHIENGFAKIPVHRDFIFGLLTNESYYDQDSFPDSKPIDTSPYNPSFFKNNLLLTHLEKPKEDELYYILGFPSKLKGQTLVLSSGRVLSQQKALKTIQKESQSKYYTPFNPEAEFLIAAPSLPGMSGGGVFNSSGALTGIVVRSNGMEKNSTLFYSRVLKIKYAKQRLYQEWENLNHQSDLYQILKPTFIENPQ